MIPFQCVWMLGESCNVTNKYVVNVGGPLLASNFTARKHKLLDPVFSKSEVCKSFCTIQRSLTCYVAFPLEGARQVEAWFLNFEIKILCRLRKIKKKKKKSDHQPPRLSTYPFLALPYGRSRMQRNIRQSAILYSIIGKKNKFLI